MSVDVCIKMIEEHDHDRYVAAKLAGPEGVARLAPIYAFNLEIARIATSVSEPMLGEIKLQWWRDAIDEIYADMPARKHEVIAPLAEVIRDAGLPKALFDNILDARLLDINGLDFEHIDQLERYLCDTNGSVLRLAVWALGGNKVTDRIAADYGFAVAAADMMRALPDLYSQGRKPMPLSPDEYTELVEGKTPDVLRQMVNMLAKDASNRLANARRNRKSMPSQCIAAMMVGWQVDRLLKAGSANQIDIFTAFSDGSEFSRRWAFMWRSLLGRW